MKLIKISKENFTKYNEYGKNNLLFLKPQIISDYDDDCLFTDNNSKIDNVVNNYIFSKITLAGLLEYYINKKIHYINNIISFMKVFKTTDHIKNSEKYFQYFKNSKLSI